MTNEHVVCPECGQLFSDPNGQQALLQHLRDKHDCHPCFKCLKSFTTPQALEQHCSNSGKHHSSSSSKRTQTNRKSNKTHHNPESHEAPFEDADGYWIKRQQFKGRKSFGWYQCQTCQKKWSSAHSFPVHKQGCKSCERKVLPCCLWVNTDEGGERQWFVDDDDDQKPHDSGRCEACRIYGNCQLKGRDHYI